jgi:hypothetical protein
MRKVEEEEYNDVIRGGYKLDSAGSREGPLSGYYEPDNESAGSIKG